MSKWRISNPVSGLVIGEYDGDTKADALDAMARDAGYEDYQDERLQMGGSDAALDVVEVDA